MTDRAAVLGAVVAALAPGTKIADAGSADGSVAGSATGLARTCALAREGSTTLGALTRLPDTGVAESTSVEANTVVDVSVGTAVATTARVGAMVGVLVATGIWVGTVVGVAVDCGVEVAVAAV